MSWRKIINMYEDGKITQMELRYQLYRVITDDNVHDFLNNAPMDVLRDLGQDLLKMPETEEEFDKMRFFHMGSWACSAAGRDSFQEKMDEEKAQVWRGLVALRKIRNHIKDVYKVTGGLEHHEIHKPIHDKANRRIELWIKNKNEGLTDDEIVEYKKLSRSVMRYIKLTYPESWEGMKRLSRYSRMRFNRKSRNPVEPTTP